MLRIAAILMLATLALPATGGAGVYKCTNADGKTYYSGQPCPASDTSEKLHVQKPSTEAKDTGEEQAAGKTLDERIAEAEDPVRKAQLELIKKECALMRTQLQRYKGAPYLVERQEDGSKRRLSDEEAEAEKQRLRSKLETDCR